MPLFSPNSKLISDTDSTFGGYGAVFEVIVAQVAMFALI